MLVVSMSSNIVYIIFILQVKEFLNADGKDFMDKAMRDDRLEFIHNKVVKKNEQTKKYINMDKATKWLQRYMKKIRTLKRKQQTYFDGLITRNTAFEKRRKTSSFYVERLYTAHFSVYYQGTSKFSVELWFDQFTTEFTWLKRPFKQAA